ncbi:MAG: hypothetical protein AB1Z19_00415 [Eubacteriales bacterium]
MESQKTNIKRVKLIENGAENIRDIYIVDGHIHMIRKEVRQSVFSGVYEMEADALIAVPFFTDSGCFALGNKEEELPKISEQEYKRFGFFSFVTMLNPLDNPARLFEQKEGAALYAESGMLTRYLTGGTRNKLYHLGENIYEDIVKSEYCVGASALVDDQVLGIDRTRFEHMTQQVNAAQFDTDKACVTLAMMGDIAEDFRFIEDAILNDKPSVVPAFVNRNKGLLNAGLSYLKENGVVMLVACGDEARMNTRVIPLSQALVRIFEDRGNLNGVLAASYSGGLLPKKNSNSLDVRGEIVNLSSELKEAVDLGVPVIEVLKTVTTNPISVFGLEALEIVEGQAARFLMVDAALNVKYIVEGNQIYPPDRYQTPVLFF